MHIITFNLKSTFFDGGYGLLLLYIIKIIGILEYLEYWIVGIGSRSSL